MSKCAIIYGTAPGPMHSYAEVPAVLYCSIHNCHMILDGQTCMIGRFEVLEERMAKLERPQRSAEIDELGNPYSLRIPVKDE